MANERCCVALFVLIVCTFAYAAVYTSLPAVSVNPCAQTLSRALLAVTGLDPYVVSCAADDGVSTPPPPPPRSPTAVTTRSTPAAWAGLLSLTSCSAENRRVQISRRTSNAARRCPRPSQSISRSPTRASRSGRGGRRTLPARSTWLSTSARSR